MSDDYDHGYHDWLEQEREWEREIAIAEAMSERERNDYELRRRREL